MADKVVDPIIIDETIEVKGKKCLEVFQVSGREIDKGKFQMKVVSIIRNEDGTYRNDPNRVKILSESETQKILKDTFVLSDETTISGAKAFEVMSYMVREVWKGKYDNDDSIKDNSGDNTGE